MAACLRHAQQLEVKPDLIINGGDAIMDAYAADDARTSLQWSTWDAVLRNECSVPVHSCIGNHDIWGWDKSRSRTTGEEPLWGKQRAMEALQLGSAFYSFDHVGWRFIVLDSVRPFGYHDYQACLDEKQFDWLSRTLRDTPATMPVFVVSHVPILGVTSLFWGKNFTDSLRVEGAVLHTDHVRIKDLFARFPNVKLCASGHTHLAERVEYNGVTYLCSGAVCGDWWRGPFKDCAEGYAVIDLFNDGSFESQYIKYGWAARTL
jgi:hypothetical protein